MRQRFRGSYLVKPDDRGRAKVPAPYLSIFENQFNRQVYLTSLNGDYTLLYPLPGWEEIERQIERIAVRDPDLDEYVNRLSFWGCESEIDIKGRVLIPPALRDSGSLHDDVLILGNSNYLALWNRENFVNRFMQGTFADERLQKVSRMINGFSTLPGHE